MRRLAAFALLVWIGRWAAQALAGYAARHWAPRSLPTRMGDGAPLDHPPTKGA